MTERAWPGINAPLALPALFFAAGIAAGRHTPFPSTDLLLFATLALAGLLNIYQLVRPVPLLRPLSIGLVFFMVGQAHIFAAKPPPVPEQLIAAAGSGRDAVFAGTVRTAPSFNGDKGRFIVDVDRLKKEGALIPVKARILLKTTFPPPDRLIPGGRLLIRASLALPSPPGTPGTFDYRQYLADRRIQLTGFVRSPAYLGPVANTLSDHGPTPFSINPPQYLRHKTNLFIDSTGLPPKIKALYKAIITGQRDSVPIEVIENFKRSGAIHLLAISGMHMGLLALLSGLLINTILHRSSWLMLRWSAWKIAALLTLPIMAGYAMISGLQPPVVRAFIMAALLIGAVVLDRPRSLLNALALAALLILAYDPTALFSVSFQLSFTAVTAIILFSNRFFIKDETTPLEQALTVRLRTWLFTGFAVSLVALIATGPITLYNFRQVSLLGPVATLLTAPLLCFWALPFGLLAALLSSALPAAAAAILRVGGLGLQGADLITTGLAAIPYGFHNLPPPSLTGLALYYLAGLGLLLLKTTGIVRTTLAIAMLSIITLPTHLFSRPDTEGSTVVSFLDVGQGSATLLELPAGSKVLVDGGGSFSPSFDPGEQLIGPFLWHRSIKRLDTLVISHPHLDHYNGLEFIVRNFRPREVWVNGESGPAEYRDLLRIAEKNGGAIKVPGHGTLIAAGGTARLTTLGNLHLHEDEELSSNNRSLVVKLESGGRKIILPGDAMEGDGQRLVDQGIDLASDVLLAPHHGSSTSAGYQLVKAGRPEWLIVSAGPFQSDKFPDPAFAEWCRRGGTKVFDTATFGTQTFIIGKNGELRHQAVSEKGQERLKGVGKY
ncbi:MAG: DNA internalization-related competence protein ComEC/Rec2 [Desulfurivibrionaceae bacterium]|nr:DNA internalization-related competence protein ComEC/Rec2 [Desulfurivibrionaceae bacterium]